MALSDTQKRKRAQKRYENRLKSLADYARKQMASDHKPSEEEQAMKKLARRWRKKKAPPEKGADKFVPRYGGFKLTRENVMAQGKHIRVCGMRSKSLHELSWKF